MKEIKVNFEKFDLNNLIEKTLEFAKHYTKPYFAIPWIYKPFDNPVYNKDEEHEDSCENIPENIERDFFSELVNEGKLLFFTFSTNNVGEPIACADGNTYTVDKEENSNEESNFYLSDTECLGYLLAHNGSELTIRSAINFSGACMCPSSISINENCGIFDAPMFEFIKKFIKDK